LLPPLDVAAICRVYAATRCHCRIRDAIALFRQLITPLCYALVICHVIAFSPPTFISSFHRLPIAIATLSIRHLIAFIAHIIATFILRDHTPCYYAMRR